SPSSSSSSSNSSSSSSSSLSDTGVSFFESDFVSFFEKLGDMARVSMSDSSSSSSSSRRRERGERGDRKRMTVGEALPILEDAMVEERISREGIIRKALKATESNGIVFIDEIDKICVSSDVYRSGADASSE